MKKIIREMLWESIQDTAMSSRPDLLSEIKLRPMHGDGSTRQFYRVFFDEETFVVIYAPPALLSGTNENDSYYYIGNHLKQKGIPVPEIYCYNREKGILLIEDLGDNHLQSVVDFKDREDESKRRYLEILKTLTEMQIAGARGFDSRHCFDTPLYDEEFVYRRELLYFKREFLGRYLGLKTENLKIDNELRNLAASVATFPGHFFMHRDFQSRNIMVKEDKFYFIDFQGARFGPPTYDLAAFLIDPYVRVPFDIQEYLLREYFAQIKGRVDLPEKDFVRSYRLTALCRNLQVLAAFVFLSRVKKKSFFAQFIDPALQQIVYTLDHIHPGMFKELRSIINDAS